MDDNRPPGTGETTSQDPAVRPLAIDTRRMRLGQVMGHEGPYVQLRPPGGGREWDARPEDVRPAREEEVLRASVAAVRATMQEQT
ncbi:hypothetical protein AB0Q95_45500 [Streptomyces sp. NPDC059900]|uniref:hypothetical protein n=1 Tax=Streptomyces sp. NPDC059900 TaxID=3155816 RepID=UPI0034236EBD